MRHLKTEEVVTKVSPYFTLFCFVSFFIKSKSYMLVIGFLKTFRYVAYLVLPYPKSFLVLPDKPEYVFPKLTTSPVLNRNAFKEIFCYFFDFLRYITSSKSEKILLIYYIIFICIIKMKY